MNKYILVFLFLFSSTHLTYISMSQKEFNLDVDDMCYYYESESNNKYVKPCEKDFYCKINNGIGICQKYSDIVKKLNEPCSSSLECDLNLECSSSKCIVQNEQNAYSIIDDVSGEAYYYCPDNLIPIYDSVNNYNCEESTEMKNNCFLNEGTEKRAFPDYFKVCGIQTIEKNQESGTYINKKTITSYIGSVEDGNFVEDERACKHGFALYFYGDKKTDTPENENPTNLFKRCVLVNEVDDNCNIKYTLDSKQYIYNTRKILSIFNTNNNIFDCSFLTTKLELFQQYVEKMGELKEECEKVKYYDEPFTCGNDELRKLWFFYNKPDIYLQYKNEEDIVNYLLQDSYHLYGFGENTTSSNSTDSSFYLSNKYYILILILLSL